jgi:hypothetical protein
VQGQASLDRQIVGKSTYPTLKRHLPSPDPQASRCRTATTRNVASAPSNITINPL